MAGGSSSSSKRRRIGNVQTKSTIKSVQIFTTDNAPHATGMHACMHFPFLFSKGRGESYLLESLLGGVGHVSAHHALKLLKVELAGAILVLRLELGLDRLDLVLVDWRL